MENCPPSGPNQNLSSPPKALKCGVSLFAAIKSWLIHPKLNPFSPSAVLVITRPWYFGKTIKEASPFFNNTKSLWYFFKNARS